MSFFCQRFASQIHAAFAGYVVLLLAQLLPTIGNSHASVLASIEHQQAHSLSSFDASVHLISAVFVPIIDFDVELCQTRLDIELRTTLQIPCSDDVSGITFNSSCSIPDADTYRLVNMSLSIFPSASSSSEGRGRQRFLFGAKDAVHTYLNGSVTLNDRGSAHHVRVFAAQSSHSHVLQWCGSAAVRVSVRAELHSSNAAGEHVTLHPVQTRDFFVVHVPDENCVGLGEQQCFDVGSDAGCFWCERAGACVHSSHSVHDAAAQCKALPDHAPPSPLTDRYSSIQCIGGVQSWPLVAPLSNRNRICMMRSVCMDDGQLTLFLSPTSNFSAFDESQLAFHNARGIAHYDGWSSLKSDIHSKYDVNYPNGDSSGFVPRVKSTSAII